jgi:hypothetical protein
MNKKNPDGFFLCLVNNLLRDLIRNKKQTPETISVYKGFECLKWSHMDSNHGPPDYESGALTN